jgi:hypothetical protein
MTTVLILMPIQGKIPWSTDFIIIAIQHNDKSSSFPAPFRTTKLILTTSQLMANDGNIQGPSVYPISQEMQTGLTGYNFIPPLPLSFQ